jgi:hypothetical protein
MSTPAGLRICPDSRWLGRVRRDQPCARPAGLRPSRVARPVGVDAKSPSAEPQGEVEKARNSLRGAVDRDVWQFQASFRRRVCGFCSVPWGPPEHKVWRVRQNLVPATRTETVLGSPKMKRVRLETSPVATTARARKTQLGAAGLHRVYTQAQAQRASARPARATTREPQAWPALRTSHRTCAAE